MDLYDNNIFLELSSSVAFTSCFIFQKSSSSFWIKRLSRTSNNLDYNRDGCKEYFVWRRKVSSSCTIPCWLSYLTTICLLPSTNSSTWTCVYQWWHLSLPFRKGLASYHDSTKYSYEYFKYIKWCSTKEFANGQCKECTEQTWSCTRWLGLSRWQLLKQYTHTTNMELLMIIKQWYIQLFFISNYHDCFFQFRFILLFCQYNNCT